MARTNQTLEVYMHSIVRRWIREALDGGDDLIVVSPYLTSQTAELILLQQRSRANTGPTVMTTLTTEVFATGASHLPTLRRLLNGGCRLYHVDELHAKIVLTPGFVSIGSQNLTQRGVRNKEATTAITDPRAITAVQRCIERWLSVARPIDLKMVDLMERHVKPLCKRMSQLQTDFDNSDVQIAAAMLRPKVDAALSQHTWLSRQEPINCELAKDFIRATAWWLLHPSGPVRAPGHAENIYRSPTHGWSLDFGSNTFLVGKALERCRGRIHGFLERIKNGDLPNRSEVERSLRVAIADSVANIKGDEYYQYPTRDNDLVFGVQSIDLTDAVRFVIDRSGIAELLDLR